MYTKSYSTIDDDDDDDDDDDNNNNNNNNNNNKKCVVNSQTIGFGFAISSLFKMVDSLANYAILIVQLG